MSTAPTDNASPRGALFAGALAALLASACCVGPLLLIGGGLSGAWLSQLQALAPLQPLFLAAAAVALVVAGRRIWRPAAAESACLGGAVCARPAARRGFKILFVAVVGLVLAVVAFPWLAPIFYGIHMTLRNLFSADVTAMVLAGLAALPVAAATRSVTLHVPGMDCPVCPITLKTALGRVDGVLATRVDYERRRLHVQYDDTKVAPAALQDATRSAGYPSQLHKAEP